MLLVIQKKLSRKFPSGSSLKKFRFTRPCPRSLLAKIKKEKTASLGGSFL
jgi:hypothetical protein